MRPISFHGCATYSDPPPLLFLVLLLPLMLGWSSAAAEARALPDVECLDPIGATWGVCPGQGRRIITIAASWNFPEA